jgi:hypothetical protein
MYSIKRKVNSCRQNYWGSIPGGGRNYSIKRTVKRTASGKTTRVQFQAKTGISLRSVKIVTGVRNTTI